MYITKIALENVRCFREATLNLESQGKPTMWTVVVGDNGDGKTTLLRSIAMGLCDEDSAAGLHRELDGDFIRTGEDKATVKVELKHRNGKRYSIVTEIHKGDAFESVTQSVYDRDLESVENDWKPKVGYPQGLESRDFPWNSIFVCGYGAGRAVEATARYREYFPLDSLYTLFKYSQPLQDPELSWRRLVMHARKHPGRQTKDDAERVANNRVTELLSKVLMLKKPRRIVLATEGIEGGEPGRRIPLEALGDGHRATIAWLLDLLCWWLLYDQEQKRQMTGIVLVDEIEQHLHPTWQRTIIGLLSEHFPRLQFITTTHSPLCARGTADLPERRAQVVIARRNGGGVAELISDLPSLGGLRADQVLASEAFGYLIESNVGTEKLLREASILAGKGKGRTRAENARYGKLKKQIKDLLVPSGQTLAEREVQSERREEMKREVELLEKQVFGETE